MILEVEEPAAIDSLSLRRRGVVSSVAEPDRIIASQIELFQAFLLLMVTSCLAHDPLVEKPEGSHA